MAVEAQHESMEAAYIKDSAKDRNSDPPSSLGSLCQYVTGWAGAEAHIKKWSPAHPPQQIQANPPPLVDSD